MANVSHRGSGNPTLAPVSAILRGSGSPEAVVTGDIGDLYSNTADDALYVKSTDDTNTGWVLLPTTVQITAEAVSRALADTVLQEQIDSVTNTDVVALQASINALGVRVTAAEATIVSHTASIATNTSNIATNTTNIATNTSSIATHTTNIATNTTAIANIISGATRVLLTGTVGTQVMASLGTISPTASMITLTSASGISLSTSAAISDGAVTGQLLILQNGNGSGNIGIPDNANTQNVSNVTKTLGPTDTCGYVWNGTDWQMISSQTL